MQIHAMHVMSTYHHVFHALSCIVMYCHVSFSVHCIFRTENTKHASWATHTHTHSSYTPIFTASILGFGAVMVGIVVRIDGLCLQACNGVKLLESGRVWMCFELFDISRKHSAWCKYVPLRALPHSNTVTDLSVQFWESFNFLHLQQVHFKPK